MVQRNLKKEQEIHRKQQTLQQYKELNLKWMSDKQKLNSKVSQRIVRMKSKEIKPDKPKNDQHTMEKLQKEFETVTQQIKTDQAKYKKKKQKLEKKLRDKCHELDVVLTQRKEKTQEKKLGYLKVKELRRIIRQHNLKPLIKKSLNHMNSSVTGRNEQLHTKQSHSIVNKTHDIQYGDTTVNSKVAENPSKSGLRLAKIEWKSKADVNSLHKSAVDLRQKYLQEAPSDYKHNGKRIYDV